MVRLIKPRLHQAIVEKWKLVDSKRPLPSEIVRRLESEFRTEFTYNTNAIEGNRLTLRETELVIEEGITVGGKSLREIYEVRNHPEALEYIERLATEGRQITKSDLLTLHQIIMKGTTDQKFLGTYRSGEVRIRGSRHVPPPAYEVDPLMEQLLYMMNNNPDDYATVELAVMVLHRVAHIHPFQDGNGRIARLLANLVLMKKRYPPIVIPRSDRVKYLSSLEKADRGDHRQIVNFVAQYAVKHLDILLRALEQKPSDRMLALKEAARLTNLSPAYLRLLANRGLIVAVKEGRNWVISESNLLEYVKRRRKPRMAGGANQ